MSSLGLDIGTTGAKGVAFDLDGRVVATAYREYDMKSPRPGHLELDPNEVLDGVAAVCREVSAATSGDPIRSVACCVLGEAITPVDADNTPLGNAIIGFDARGADECDRLREQIDNNITFWKMSPAPPAKDDGGRTSIFSNVNAEFRVMQWRDREYVLASNGPRSRLKANLPAGRWTVTRYDVVARKQRVLHDAVSGAVEFDTPNSRAVLFHVKRR